MCLLRKFHRLKGPSLCVRRLTVLGVLLGILEWDRSDTCVLLLWQYVIGYEGLFVVCMMVEFYICFLATRGSILDTTARAPMQYVLYFRLCEYLYLVLIVNSCYISIEVPSGIERNKIAAPYFGSNIF